MIKKVIDSMLACKKPSASNKLVDQTNRLNNESKKVTIYD